MRQYDEFEKMVAEIIRDMAKDSLDYQSWRKKNLTSNPNLVQSEHEANTDTTRRD